MSSSLQNKCNRTVPWKLLHYGKCQALTLFSAFWWARKKFQLFGKIHSLTKLLFFPSQPTVLQSIVHRVKTCEKRVSGLHRGICAHAGYLPSSSAKSCTWIRKGLSPSAGYFSNYAGRFLSLAVWHLTAGGQKANSSIFLQITISAAWKDPVLYKKEPPRTALPTCPDEDSRL